MAATAQPHHHFHVAIVLAACVAYAAVLASRARGWLRDALLLLAALFVVPAVAEGICAAITPPPGPFARYSATFDNLHPILGYAPLPSRTVEATKTAVDGRTIFKATYTIDEHGLRRTASNPAGPTIAFFFDSMTFGEGLQDGETLPQQFADLTGHTYHVVNLGFPGYGPQAMLRTLETGFHDENLQRDPAFFVVQTAPWHAERAACRASFVLRTPRYSLIDGRAAFQGPCAEGWGLWRRQSLNKSHLYRNLIAPLLVDAQGEIELYLAELRDSVALARRKYGANVIILFFRAGREQFANTTYDDDKLIAALRETGATVLDVKQAEDGEDGLQIAGDGHPTAKANQLRAALIRDEIARTTGAVTPDRH